MGMMTEQSLMVFCSILCFVIIAEAIDCRKFVFAPRCRGVSAKRSSPKINSEELGADLGELEDMLMEYPRTSNGETLISNRKNSILQKLLEKFNDYSLNDN